MLILSVAGGLGVATIQMAKMLKADICMTGGGSEQRKRLIDTLETPNEKIFNLRSMASHLI